MMTKPVAEQKIELFARYSEPEDYGDYLVFPVGSETATIARFDHPVGERETGWYHEKEGKIDIRYWAHMPKLMSDSPVLV